MPRASDRLMAAVVVAEVIEDTTEEAVVVVLTVVTEVTDEMVATVELVMVAIMTDSERIVSLRWVGGKGQGNAACAI